MRTNILSASLLAVFFALAARPASARTLHVVATIPELGDIAERVGGDHVSVDTLARGTEDIHQVVMRPSLVPKLNRADAVVYLGLTVEHSFLPGLLNVANNPNLRTDVVKECVGAGCIDCSEGLAVLEKPSSLSRSEGEIHPFGNPHYNVDPADGVLIAKNIEAGLVRIDPDHAADYEKNLKAYLAELNAKLAEWRKWVAPLKGMKAVSYHQDVVYLGRFTGIDFIGTIELKPGVAPTPTHLEQLVQLMKQEHVPLIVREQQYDPKMPEWLAENTGAKVAVIGTMSKALPDTDTFIKMSEHNLKAILAAVGKAP
ncbi:MAG TPA: metal ABC transporter substrate-binding protein [Elusimicrobiota bacterium]|nr:metal ABC transporter substrate-binding protein [Elusimicrobiota bacterium]